ncbi:EAL domain-containing protein [Pelomonas sp. SE-A7]|uniref:putative bifunctional diguanylate cyclase/phosphodiesterase n=1 Tax=Pelomonas sp. SE-A7 TaxID=3054953 RepID=UPI00259D0995|nr:EAL domain-containing protein [Pelomonas sp. SE-A7]MDM4765426.1 EAL domain-containing protein [Pelomonas sp. SE-A7]
MLDESIGIRSPQPGWPSVKQLLDGFNSAEGPLPQPFNRRRRRMLVLGSLFILFTVSFWACFFAFKGQFWLTALDLALAVSAGGVLWMARNSQLRLAGLVFLAICLSFLLVVATLADVPTTVAPRTLHLYMVPLTVYSVFLLQHERFAVRAFVVTVVLLCFAVLAMAPVDLAHQHFMSESQRRVGAVLNVISSTVLLFLVIDIMLREAKETSALELDFARAVATGEVLAYLQPQCTADGRIVGAEALMRWRHSKRGYVSPAEFIPMAERSGLIIPAGEQIAAIICKALHRWEDDPVLRELTVSVNVSSAQLFSGASTARLLGTVSEAAAPRASLKFELTESMFVQDFQAVRGKMEEIRGQGIRMALDDFGTGFSSLSYLKQLPLDQIKVDQSFVRDLPGDASAAKIAATIVHLGEDLGLEVVAEGVENREQLTALEAMGCRIFQGFLFARPLPLEEFEALARSGKTLPVA